ncbi:cysteine synthase family protein [Cuniculiplasma sp. SKW4]|uniref:cysteine synthase family protein n=1 Tax=Cuniculiplasma sp. SKW4 TaxID=3400171 RepID=UPI003FCF35CE
MELQSKMDLCRVITEKFYARGYGNTPLMVFQFPNNSQVIAKAEWFNPSGSIKSRAAFFMVMERILENDQNLYKTFVEGTSGNTGIAIAEVCKTLGIKSKIIIPPGTMEETVKKLRETGTDLVITDEDTKTTSTEKAIQTALSLSEDYPHEYVSLHQHANPLNWMSHYFTTGPEIRRNFKKRIDFVAIAMGTGGSIIGLSKFFKEVNESINIMVQVDESSYIQGIRNYNKAKDKKIIVDNLSYIDSISTVSAEDARYGIKELAEEYGVMPGFSSGSNFIAAKRIALANPGSVVLTVFPDSAEKYAGLYERLGIINRKLIEGMDFRDLSKLKGDLTVVR